MVPSGSIPNERYKGSMLLRVPPATLKALKGYGEQVLKDHGKPYMCFATRIGFDLESSYPKLTFRAMRELSLDEQYQVAALYEDDATERVLGVPLAAPAEIETPAKTAAPAPAPEPEPEPAPAPAAAPEPEGVIDDGFGGVAMPSEEETKPAAAKPAAKPATKPAAKTVEQTEVAPEDATGEVVDDMLNDMLSGFETA